MDDTDPTKKPARKKPTDTRPFHVYANIGGQIALEDVEAPSAEVALVLAKELRASFDKKLDKVKLGNGSIHVSELHVTRFGVKRDDAYDPPRAPEPSAAMVLFNTLMDNRSRAVRQSDRRSNPVECDVVSLAIAAGLHFDKTDLGGKDGISFRTSHYQEAISHDNISFCQAYEAHAGRPPFFFDGRLYIGRVIEWPSGSWREKSAPWPDNAPPSWDGSRAEITSFGTEKDVPYVVACSRRQEGEVTPPHHGWEKRVDSTEKIKRRFKIPLVDMRFFERAREEGTQLDAWMAEIMPQLRSWEIAIREDVLRAAPKEIRAAVKEFTSAYWNRERPPACIDPLVLESARIEAFEPARLALSRAGVNGIGALVLAGWTPEQLAAVQAWAEGAAYELPAELRGLVSEDHVRARAVLTAENGTIQALLGSITEKCWHPFTRAVLPRLTFEMAPADLALLLEYGRANLGEDPTRLAEVIATDDGLRVRKVIAAIMDSVGYEVARRQSAATGEDPPTTPEVVDDGDGSDA